jgi:hypothetical protein
MQLRKFKINVHCGEYSGGYNSVQGGIGTWYTSSSQQFDVVIEAQYPQQAEKIAQAQFGGPARCKIYFRGEVR